MHQLEIREGNALMHIITAYNSVVANKDELSKFIHQSSMDLAIKQTQDHLAASAILNNISNELVQILSPIQDDDTDRHLATSLQMVIDNKDQFLTDVGRKMMEQASSPTEATPELLPILQNIHDSASLMLVPFFPR